MGAETNIDIRSFEENGGSMSDYTLESSDNTIDVQTTETGHDIKVAQNIIDTLNNKQDIPIAGGLRTNGIEARYFGINLSGYPDTCITGVHINDYIPLFEIYAFNGGKSQLSFELISREDSAGYYSKFFFASRGTSFIFIRTDYYNKPVIASGEGYFDKNAIVVVQDSDRYLICKKTLKTDFDAYIVNDFYRDSSSYCKIQRYTTFTESHFTDPDIKRASAMTMWRNKIIADTCVQPIELESDSVNVTYDNTSSQASATNVQDALDDLYQKYNNIINNI